MFDVANIGIISDNSKFLGEFLRFNKKRCNFADDFQFYT